MRLLPVTKHTPIGLDVTPRRIHAMQLQRRSGGWRVGAVMSTPREQSTLTPEAEELDRVRGALPRHGFVGHRIVAAVPTGLVMSAVLELPPRESGAPIEVIATGELSRIHQRDPLEVSAGCWDLPKPARAGVPVMAVGCSHHDANEFLDTVESTGLSVVALDTRMLATARAVSVMLSDPGRISAVCDLGWSSTRLFVMHQGVVVYERRLTEYGIKGIHEAITGRSGVDDEVAEMLVGQVGMGAASTDELGALAEQTNVSSMLSSMGDKLIPEISASFSYAEHRYPDATARELIMVGDGATVPGLNEQIIEGIGCETRIFRPTSWAGNGGGLNALSESPTMAAAMGLAMFGVN